VGMGSVWSFFALYPGWLWWLFVVGVGFECICCLASPWVGALERGSREMG